jgi:hypothetical protein
MNTDGEDKRKFILDQVLTVDRNVAPFGSHRNGIHSGSSMVTFFAI